MIGADALSGWRSGGVMRVRALRKRGFDLVFSALLLTLLALPLFLVAVCIRCDSPGPALFVQERVGRKGRPFRIYKFRTMSTQAPADRPSEAFSPEEKAGYLTRIGRFLRKTSIDELPQLYNVLCGDMSLVGPRPVIPEEEELVALRMRLGVYALRPGITGLAQISGRDEISKREKVALDLLYLRALSPALDRAILRATLSSVLFRRGVRD